MPNLQQKMEPMRTHVHRHTHTLRQTRKSVTPTQKEAIGTHNSEGAQRQGKPRCLVLNNLSAHPLGRALSGCCPNNQNEILTCTFCFLPFISIFIYTLLWAVFSMFPPLPPPTRALSLAVGRALLSAGAGRTCGANFVAVKCCLSSADSCQEPGG